MNYDLEDRAAAAEDLAPIAQGGSGQVVTLHQPASAGVFIPVTETTTGATGPVEHTGSGIELTYSAYSIGQGLVAAGDIKFLLSPLKDDGTPMPRPVADSWTLSMGAKRFAIKKADPLEPAGTPVLFELQLRGPPK